MRKSRSNIRRGPGRGRGHRSRRDTMRKRGLSSLSELGIAGSLVGTSALFQGSELEQDTQNMMGGRGKRNPGCGNDIADHILCFLELLNTIKIYHWSTMSYPTHKATDELHGKLSELVDSFIEIYIGHCARGGGGGGGSGVPVFTFKTKKSASIAFCECKSLAAFCKVIDDNIVHLQSLTDKLNGYTDLVNTRDEMVGALTHALYLLRLH